MRTRKGITITVLRDGELGTTSYRIPFWGIRAALAGLVAAGVLLVLAVAFYGPIASQAGRVPGLVQEVERLSAENARIQILVAALDSAEASYTRIRGMVGADIVPEPDRLPGALPVAPAITVVPAGRRRRLESGPSTPRHWPLDARGFITRGQDESNGAEEAHVGVDVAVPIGAVVRAAGGGTVVAAREDREYGLFVMIEHPDGYQSRYGHLSRLVVAPGQRIRAGEPVGRSGNTGRSSAPHLHFEIRRDGAAVDPMTMVPENR